MDNEHVDLPRRERLNDNDPRDQPIIEAQLQASTTAQRIEDARRRGVAGEFEPEQNMW